jgi:hypothetical protein
MRARWSIPVRVRAFDSDWDSMPTTPGVYIVRKSGSIPRVGGVDRSGILYLGKASSLRSRVWGFWYTNHTASGFLWTHPDLAALVLGARLRSVRDVEKAIDGLTVRYATPVAAAKLARAERAMMWAYLSRFGEAPPLNLNLARRWDTAPGAADRRWAELGVLARV